MSVRVTREQRRDRDGIDAIPVPSARHSSADSGCTSAGFIGFIVNCPVIGFTNREPTASIGNDPRFQ